MDSFFSGALGKVGSKKRERKLAPSTNTRGSQKPVAKPSASSGQQQRKRSEEGDDDLDIDEDDDRYGVLAFFLRTNFMLHGECIFLLNLWC